jgi:ArsR family transcriptional regulator
MRNVSQIENMKVEIPEDIKKEVNEKGGFNLIKTSVPMEDIQRLDAIIGVLADKKRLMILYALSRQRMCVCMLADITQSLYSKCSYHITRLKNRGIITAQNEGNYLIYSLTPYGKNILKILEKLKEVIE